MKLDKILRVLVCLAMVCCIILNVAAMPAHAVGVDWILRQIATDIGITGILEGLGLFRDALNGDEYYNDLVSDVKDHLANTGQITGDYIDAYWRIDPLNANPVLTIPLALISAVRNYIFDNGVVSQSVSVTSSTFTIGSDSYSFSAEQPMELAFFWRTGYSYYAGYVPVAYCLSTSVMDTEVFVDGESRGGSHYGNYYVVQLTGGSSGSTWNSKHPATSLRVVHDSTGKTSWDSVFSSYFGNSVSSVWTDNPLLLGVISPSNVLFDAAYPQWIEHQKEQEDGTTVPMVQIGLGNSVSETESLTQEQIWSGQGTVSVPDTEEDEAHVPVTLPEWLQQGLDNLRLGLQDISSTLLELPAAIAEKVAAIFIPSTDYLTAKVEALRGEFGFIDSVIATGEFIRDSVSGASGPPVIYVDLGRAPSGNYGSQRVLLTDFSWYAPYKGQVDTVLSAALWAFFGWRVFMKLPGIIGGESGYISDVFFSSSSGRSGSDDKKKGGKG